MRIRTVPWLMLAVAACQDPPGGGPSAPTEPTVPGAADPGARTVARLNRAEYNNAIRDVLGSAKTPADVFPMDERANGFDNQGAALTTTSTHVELWELAADQVLAEMFGRKDETTLRYAIQVEDAGVTYEGLGLPYGLTGYTLVDGSLSSSIALDYDGLFSVTALAFGRPGDGIDPSMSVTVDGSLIETFDVDAPEGAPDLYAVETDLAAGLHTVEVAITNPYDDGFGDRRSLTIDWIEVEGPLDPEGELTDAYAQFVGCGMDENPDAVCAETAIAALGKRLWGRPLTDDDLAWAMALYDNAVTAGEDTSWSLEYALKGLLTAPEFLYHLESSDPTVVQPLDGYEVADRLASFLWSSPPDAALIDAATTGDLLAEGGVAASFDRMFADARAAALVDRLATQWFDIDVLDTFVPDLTLYPMWDDELAAAMETELHALAEGFFLGDDDLTTMLLSQEGWIDERLAEHYAVTFMGAEGALSLQPTGRTGLLGTAGWLTAHSRPDAPSAVRRGKWIVENLLCDSPPPPPPEVEAMFMPVESEGSIRQQEEALRADAYCQACHATMDAVGYALYGYDVTGHVRTTDELGYPIDTVVVLDGVPISDPAQLAAWVANDPRLPTCIVEKTMTYALGRALRDEDDPVVAAVTDQFVAGGLTFRALASAVTTSPAFLSRSPVPMAVE